MANPKAFTTFQEKIDAINAVKILCERNQFMSDSMFQRRYRVYNCVSKLLEAGVIKPTDVKGYYTWVEPDTTTTESIVSLLWKRNSSAFELDKPKVEDNTLASKIEKAMALVHKYGIANQSAFIADFLKGDI